jgi:hypothetical protein
MEYGSRTRGSLKPDKSKYSLTTEAEASTEPRTNRLKSSASSHK